LILSAESGVKRTDADNTVDLTHSGTANLANSNTEIIYYRITNNPGAVLPSTGGPGTNLIYILGIMLTGLAGAGLVMKRRRRNTV
jgi:LPXTG-motif cell wall-anchored protein